MSVFFSKGVMLVESCSIVKGKIDSDRDKKGYLPTKKGDGALC